MSKIYELKDISNSIPVSINDALDDCRHKAEELDSVLILTTMKNGGTGYYQGVDRKEGLLKRNEILWMIEAFKLHLLNNDFD